MSSVPKLRRRRFQLVQMPTRLTKPLFPLQRSYDLLILQRSRFELCTCGESSDLCQGFSGSEGDSAVIAQAKATPEHPGKPAFAHGVAVDQKSVASGNWLLAGKGLNLQARISIFQYP